MADKKEEKKQRSEVSIDEMLTNGHLVEGKWYAVVTVSPIYHGRLKFVNADYYGLEDATWIVETGRLNEFVKNPAGTTQEAEFLGPVLVERGSVMAVYPTPEGSVPTK